MMHGSLATKLRVLRAERGFTLREAERLTGVDKDTLSKLERGLRYPHDVTLSRIAKGYGIPVEELLEEPALAGKAEAPREPGQLEEEAEVRSLEVPYMDRAAVREWLELSGHMSRAAFSDYVEDLNLDLDEEGWPRGLARAVADLRRMRDHLTEELKKPAIRDALFPRRLGLPTKEERIKEALRPVKEAWKLRAEIRFEYLTRELDIINYGRRLHAEGVTQGHLAYAPAAELERRLAEMEKAVLAEAEAA
jgi:transcriptional regulator with XRE-family HTH domain